MNTQIGVELHLLLAEIIKLGQLDLFLVKVLNVSIFVKHILTLNKDESCWEFSNICLQS